ncbi:matrilysin-like [Harmonia axyridis]|uniref:matrilysin-like n=1 Tax=Harmonia axyridis TaxID=115357 RepID=UPI001E276CE5|nr:matrilysin-like [Harmonia axyridis]
MLLFYFLCVIHICWSLPVQRKAILRYENALNFMKQYGYLKEDKGNFSSYTNREELSETIKTVQRFGALKETGRLDDATMKLMSTPRCGNADVLNGKRHKRYILVKGWNKRHITYHVKNWPTKLGSKTVDALINKALKTWGDYGNLKFRRKSTEDADIIVSFNQGDHYDGFPFDGRGYVLAHAFFPLPGSSLAGHIHFDADEKWVKSTPNQISYGGTDFFSVALHELGHSLGLGHSTDERSIMFAYYKESDENIRLSQDDIYAMYKLYIQRPIVETTKATTTKPQTTTRPTNSTPPTNTTPRSPKFIPIPNFTQKRTTQESTTTTPSTKKPPIWKGRKLKSKPDICQVKFDAVAKICGKIFIFKDEYIWRLQDHNQSLPNNPVPLRQIYPNLPGTIRKIDAAYQKGDGNVILFTGDVYWEYDGLNFTRNSPRSVKDYGIPEGSGGVDAVLTSEVNGLSGCPQTL